MRLIGFKFESLTKEVVTMLVLVSVVISSVSAPVYAEDPAITGAVAASPPAVPDIASAPPLPDIPQTLPYGESLEKVAYFERFVSGLYNDFLNAPDWFVTTIGLGVAMVAANQLRLFFSKDVVALMRHYFAYRHIRAVHQEGEKLFPKLEIYADILAEDADRLWKSTQQMEELRRGIFNDEIKRGMANRRAIQWLRESAETTKGKLATLSPIEQMEELRTNETLRHDLVSNGGTNLLRQLDKKFSDHHAVERQFFSTHGKIADAVQEYFKSVANVGNIWFARNKELQPSIPKMEAQPHARGELGTIQHWNDLGGPPEYVDPRKMPHELRNTIRQKCDGYFSKLGSLKTDHEVAVRVATVRGSSLAGVGAAALGTYFYGKSRIKEVYNAEPTQLIDERDKRDQAQAVQAGIVAANTATSVKEMAEKVRHWRLDPKNENAHAIFRIIEDQLKLNLPNIAASLEKQLREKLGPMAIDAGAWERTLQTHLSNPEVLAGTIDLAIADAIINEAKATDPTKLEDMLLRTDPAETIKEKSRSSAISHIYSIAPKYVWDIIADRSTYPSATGMVEETARVLDIRRREVMAADKGKETAPARADTKPAATDSKDRTVKNPAVSTETGATSLLDAPPQGYGDILMPDAPPGEKLSMTETTNSSITSALPAGSDMLMSTMPPLPGSN